MDLKIVTRPRTDQEVGVDVDVIGDHQAFFWLVNAAGSAQSGFDTNQAETTDGAGNRLRLIPSLPLPEADQKRRSTTAHSNVTAPGAVVAGDNVSAERAQLEVGLVHQLAEKHGLRVVPAETETLERVRQVEGNRQTFGDGGPARGGIVEPDPAETDPVPPTAEDLGRDVDAGPAVAKPANPPRRHQTAHEPAGEDGGGA